MKYILIFFLFFSSSESTALDSPSQATVTQGVAGDTPPPGSEDSPMQSEEAAPADRGVSPMAQAPPSPSMRPAGNGRGSQPPPGATVITANLSDPKGTNHILRKHLYSTKPYLTTYIPNFSKNWVFFLSKQKNFFFNITF